MLYAHTKNDQNGNQSPQSDWELLHTHLQEVAELAEKFATSLMHKKEIAGFGYQVGLWHDLGKASKTFQDYIRTGKRVGDSDHSSYGAIIANRVYGRSPIGYAIAHCIAGHHTGLLDRRTSNGEPSLDARFNKASNLEPAIIRNLIVDLLNNIKTLAMPIPPRLQKATLHHSTFVRMLFSCLIDADRLCTARFTDRERGYIRQEHANKMASYFPDRMLVDLDAYICKRQKNAQSSTVVTEVRNEVLNNCTTFAGNELCLLLTVPTGGGKTLSSLRLALGYAQRQRRLKRVIYAVPFIAVTEQISREFKKVFADYKDVVLEHHSNIDSNTIDDNYINSTENWDLPLVVTTTVQFFESLFSNRTSACRKLHNIANSVIILDEVQMLPAVYLKPCLLMLQELMDRYGCVVVLCTATQPAVIKSEYLPNGLSPSTEVIADPDRLSTSLRRVEIKDVQFDNLASLASQLATHDKVLCVVNSRKNAYELYQMLANDDHTYHLSTYMCGRHRAMTLRNIDKSLKGDKCVVISTSLIEAGIDIDFPVVYRARAGVDSIVQAAGRCNRHGLLPTLGKVFVFDFVEPYPVANALEKQIGITEVLCSKGPIDYLDLGTIKNYFINYYNSFVNSASDDQYQIVGDSDKERFQTVSKNFNFIEENKTIIILYNNRRLFDKVRSIRQSGDRLGYKLGRALQRYCVSVNETEFNKLVDNGKLDTNDKDANFGMLLDHSLYSTTVGLQVYQL